MKISDIDVGDTVKVNNTCVDGNRGMPIEREYPVLLKGNDNFLLLSVPKNEGGYNHFDTPIKDKTTYWYSASQVLEVTKNNPVKPESPVKIGDMIRITNRKALLSSIPEKEQDRLMCADHEVIAVTKTGEPVVRMLREYGGHTYYSPEPGRIIFDEGFEKILSPMKKEILVVESESTPSKSDPIKVGDWVSPTEEAKKQIQDGRRMRFCPPYLRKELSELKFEVTAVNESILMFGHIPPKYCLGDWEVNAKDYILATQVQKEDPVKKEPKYQVFDRVFLPKRFKDELPEDCFNGIPGNEYFEFSIIYKQANSTDVDYFLSMTENNGGKWESKISRSGRWINEKFLLSREEMEVEKKKNQPIDEMIREKLSKKENEKMSYTMTSAVKTDGSAIAQYEKQMEEVTIFSGIAVPAVEFAKTCIRYAAHVGCKALGKSGEFVGHVMAIVEEFLKDKKEVVDNICRWVLGFLAKNVHYLRKIPGIKDTNYLAFLESEQIQRFGIYAQASAKGDVIGELATRVFAWIQEWAFGTAVVASIKDAIASPDGFVRFMSETDAKMRVSLVEKIQQEQEAEREVTAINEMKPAMASAVA